LTHAEEIRDQNANLPTVVGFLLLLWLLISLGTYFLVAAPRGQRFDLFPRWVGARAVLRGESPYSEEITWQIQEGMFGGRLEPGEDQQRFAYSAMITWLLLPLWLLPFPWAASLCCGLQLLLLLILPIWVAAILGWRLRTPLLVLILIFSILVFRYPINAYLLGQLIPLCLACLVAGWWGIVRGHWFVASLALVLATARPEVVMIPLLAILIVAWHKGDRRIVFAWMAGMLSLWLLTRAWIGPWELDYIRGIQAYQVYSSPIWPPGVLKQPWLALLVVMMVVAWSAWMWRESRFLGSAEQLGWQISVAVLTSLLLLPQTGSYTLTLALVPAWVILWASRHRRAYWVPALAVLASPWIFLFIEVIPTALEHLLIPVSLAILLALQWRLRRGIATLDGTADLPSY
jgi:hypothetical protein